MSYPTIQQEENSTLRITHVNLKYATTKNLDSWAEAVHLRRIRSIRGNSDEFRYKYSTRKYTAQKVPVFSFGPFAELFKGSFDKTDSAGKLFSILGKEIEEPNSIGMKLPQ